MTEKKESNTLIWAIVIPVMAAIFLTGGIFVYNLYFEPNIEASCTMNGFGSGKCSFTNSGNGSGTMCGTVEVSSSEKNDFISSSRFCSGNIEPSTTLSVDFDIPYVHSYCSIDGKRWNDACSFFFKPDNK